LYNFIILQKQQKYKVLRHFLISLENPYHQNKTKYNEIINKECSVVLIAIEKDIKKVTNDYSGKAGKLVKSKF
jgi:hypothetical protein